MLCTVPLALSYSLLNRVERPPSSYQGGARFIPRPRPPPGSPPSHTQQRRPPSSRPVMDRGAAGEPYSVRPQPMNVTSMQPATSALPSQFHPGFGPAASNLMINTRGMVRGEPMSEDETSPEISISEGDLDLTRMEELMDIYSGNPTTDPRAMMAMPMPGTDIAMGDDEQVSSSFLVFNFVLFSALIISTFICFTAIFAIRC